MPDTEYPFWDVPPTEEAFEDLRQRSIELRIELDPEFHHNNTEWLASLKNYGSNFMAIFQRFDIYNQRTVVKRLKPETVQELIKRDPNYLLINVLGEVPSIVENILNQSN